MTSLFKSAPTPPPVIIPPAPPPPPTPMPDLNSNAAMEASRKKIAGLANTGRDSTILGGRGGGAGGTAAAPASGSAYTGTKLGA